jgi:hypothetical protein
MDRSGLIQLQPWIMGYIYTQLSFTEGTPGTRHEQAMLGQGNDTGWPCATYNVVAVALQRRT